MLWDPLGAWPQGRRWLWAALALVVTLLQAPRFGDSLWPARENVTDFYQDWSSARNLREGLPVYAPLSRTIERDLGRRDMEHLLLKVNAHPPTSVLLALPFTSLDYFDAILAWNLLSLGALTAALWLVVRRLGLPVSGWSAFPATAIVLLCNPLFQQNWQGQLNALLALLLTAAWAAERAGRPRLAGVWLGAAAAIKLFPAFLLLYFAARRRWATVAAGLLSLALLTALTAAVLGPAAFGSYARDVLPQVGAYRSSWNNASLTGLCRKLFGPVETPGPVWDVIPLWDRPALSQPAALALAVAVLAVLHGVARRARTPAESDEAFGLAVVAMLLVSPITWDHYFLLLLVPLAVAWTRLPASGWARAWFLLTVVGLWLPPTFPTPTFRPGDPTGVAGPWFALGALSIPSYALLSLFLLLVRVAALRGPARAPQPREAAPAGELGPRALTT